MVVGEAGYRFVGVGIPTVESQRKSNFVQGYSFIPGWTLKTRFSRSLYKLRHLFGWTNNSEYTDIFGSWLREIIFS